MIRAILVTIVLGLTPALADDIGAPILDDLPTCGETCPEATVTAMSSDLDGDGDAEYFDIYDAEAEITLAEADCSAEVGTTCSMAINVLPAGSDHQI